MAKPKALPVGIAAKASASAEAQIRKRLPAVATSSPSILSRPRSRMEIDESSSEEEGAKRRKPPTGTKVEALPQDLDVKTLAKIRHTNWNIAEVEDRRVVITDRRRVEYRIRWFGESESIWENAAMLLKRNRRARNMIEIFDHTQSCSEAIAKVSAPRDSSHGDLTRSTPTPGAGVKHHQAAREMKVEVELEKEREREEPGVVDLPKLFKRLGGVPEPIRVCCIKERRVQTHLKLDMCRHITR